MKVDYLPFFVVYRVSYPDAFDMVAFSNQMKAIFGFCVIEIIIV